MAIEFVDADHALISGHRATSRYRRYLVYGAWSQGWVRDIKTSPDGSLYVVLNKPDMIIRLTPD